MSARFAGKNAHRNGARSARRRLRGRGARHNRHLRNAGSAVTGRVAVSGTQSASDQTASKSIGSAARGNVPAGSALLVNEPGSALPANAQDNEPLESALPANAQARTAPASALAGSARHLPAGAAQHRPARAPRAGSGKKPQFSRVWNRSIGCGFLPRSRL